MKQSFRIGIDCRLSGSDHAGIGRYIEELTLRLPQINKNISWVYFFYSQSQANNFIDKLKRTNGYSEIETVIVPINHYSIAEQLQLPKVFGSQKLDLLHVPHFNIPILYSGKLVVTIHDLLWHEFRGMQVTTLGPIKYLLKYFAYLFTTNQAVKKARFIFVPANTIKKTVIKHYPWSKNKLVVTKEGADQLFKPALTNHSPGKTLVYVGSQYPHKNLRVVLQALQNLPEFNLKLIGSRNVFSDQTKKMVDKLNLNKQVDFVGYLPDTKLNQLLNSAFALVQPSLSEGFGLTGIEAMASGVPVLASHIPIFKEIYQDGALYFDPNQSEQLVEAINRLDEAQRSALIKKGLAVAKQYSWEKMAQETMTVYERALK